MRLVSLVVVSLGLAAALTACEAEVEDGIFDPSAGGPLPGGGSGSASATGTGASDTEDETGLDTGDPGTSDPAATDGTDTDPGDGDSTGVTDVGTCPEAVGPGVYTCPEGSTFSSGGGWARCTYEDVPLPAAPSLSAYCQYLDKGYLGFSWSLNEVAAHECLPEARYAPSGQVAYCLWEDIVLPTALAEADCGGLVATGDLGFRWPCPAG